jgi:hypothetical protein
MAPPINFNSSQIQEVTINGTPVQEITVNGNTAFSAVSLSNKADHQWKFDESSGTVAADSIGSLDGQLQGGMQFVSNSQGIGGNVVNGNGSDSEVTFPSTPPYIKNPGDFAIGISVMDVSKISGRETIMSFNDTNDNDGGGFNARNQDFGFKAKYSQEVVDIGASISTLNNNLSSPVRCLFNYNSIGDFDLFFNDDNSLSSATVNLDATDGGQMKVGSLNDRTVPKFIYEGEIDNFVIYDDSLTRSEITDDFKINRFA